MTNETWKAVVGFEGMYDVSDHGRVRSYVPQGDPRTPLRRDPRMLKPGTTNGGYPTVVICGKMRRIHRLVAAAFIGPIPDGMVVCHNDGDPTNPRVENLRYDTQAGNMADMRRHGTALLGERRTNHKLTAEKVRWIRSWLAVGVRVPRIADHLEVNREVVYDVGNGRTWGHVA